MMYIIKDVETNFKQQYKQECIPVGCVPPAAVAVLGRSPPGTPGTRHPRDQAPPRTMHLPGTRQPPRTRHPLRTRHPPGPGTPGPGNSSPGTPLPGTRHPLDQATPRTRHPLRDQAPPRTRYPPVNRMTNRCKNITLPQT